MGIGYPAVPPPGRKMSHVPPASDSPPPTEPLPKPSDAAASVLAPWRTLAERGVAALEKLNEEPVIDVPVKPPVCPHCERLNPMVRVQESEATGPLFEFVIQCECLHCHEVFYAVAEGWNCIPDLETTGRLIKERAEFAGYANNSGKN